MTDLEIQVPGALRDPRLSHAAKLGWTALYFMMMDGPSAPRRIALRTICSATHISMTTMSPALMQLEELGYIERKQERPGQPYCYLRLREDAPDRLP